MYSSLFYLTTVICHFLPLLLAVFLWKYQGHDLYVGAVVYIMSQQTLWHMEPLNVEDTEVYYVFFQPAFCVSDRRQYSGSLLKHLGVMLLLSKGEPLTNYLHHCVVVNCHAAVTLIVVDYLFVT